MTTSEMLPILYERTLCAMAFRLTREELAHRVRCYSITTDMLWLKPLNGNS